MQEFDSELRQIVSRSQDSVSLTAEDPETFGAGHYVLCSDANANTRLTATEQYAGTDSSDPDRLPNSWEWRREML